MRTLGPKEREIMDFLHKRIFNPILVSLTASESLKQGVRYTIMRMEQRDAAGMIQYYWSSIIGTERSIGFGKFFSECSHECPFLKFEIPRNRCRRLSS